MNITPTFPILNPCIPLDIWEHVLDTTFHVYHDQTIIGHDHSMHTTNKKPIKDRKSAARGEFVVRCDQYSLPTSLLEHVSFVFNTVQIPIHHRHHQLQLPLLAQDLTYNSPTIGPFTTLTTVNDATDNAVGDNDVNDNAKRSDFIGTSRNIFPYSSASSLSSSHTTLTAAATTAAVSTTATTNAPSAKPTAKPSVRPSSSQPTSQPTQEPTNAPITGTLKSTVPHCFVNNTMTPCRLRQGID